MDYRNFAEKLLKVSAEKRSNLLKNNPNFCVALLAKTFQDISYEVWTNEPQKISEIVLILREIVDLTKDIEIEAYAEWTQGIENLIKGNLKNSLQWLNKSENSFKNIGKLQAAATTQTSKLYVLAMLGKYDEAVDCGLRARDIFLQNDDIYSAGKIEHNIGNLFWRRDFYTESEPYLASAHQRFLQINDQRQLAMVENCQAFVKALQNDFTEAETIYSQALTRSKENNLTVTEAEIETGMSNLYLFQGRFDLALKFLEHSRQKYDSLKMPHQSANCLLEIADIYLELNLLPEAREFYLQAIQKFSEIGMQAELGRCFLNLAKTLFLLDENEFSAEYLEKAKKCFIEEGNEISLASVHFANAQLLFRRKNFVSAEKEAKIALKTFQKRKTLRQELLSNWLLSEILSAQNKHSKAIEILQQTLKLSEENFPPIEYLCLVSLGKLTKDEKYFLNAIEIIENSRSSLSAEEFRTSFLADKLLPYNELVKINLARQNFSEAFSWIERSRSRTLAEALEISTQEANESEKLASIKAELNWFYSRLNRENKGGLEAKKELGKLRKTVVLKEKEYAEELRRQKILSDVENNSNHNFDLKNIQKNLTETTILKFIVLDEKISAFVISQNDLLFFENLVDENLVNQEIEQFIFQIKTARFLDKLSPEFQKIAYKRMIQHSQKLYDLLIRPLEKHLEKDFLTIIPSKFLHYLPFQALHNGKKYLIENFGINYSPSLGVWQNLWKRKLSLPKKSVLVGVSDKITPLVKEEIQALSSLFEKSVELVNKNATLQNLRESLSETNVLHLACHGKFRPDNPAFSSLNLYQENLSFNDARNLNLKNALVVLSACETGLNKIISGEELIGLTKGFLLAGASSLIVSFWTVNDKSTLKLMKNFYQEFLSTNKLNKSLQTAQIQLLNENSHPYFWSAFALI